MNLIHDIAAAVIVFSGPQQIAQLESSDPKECVLCKDAQSCEQISATQVGAPKSRIEVFAIKRSL